MSQLFHSLQKPFESEFGKLKEELIRLGDIMKEEVSLATKIQQDQEYKEEAREREDNSLFRLSTLSLHRETAGQLAEARKWRQRRAKIRLLKACSVYNHETALNQARRKGSFDWIFHNESYEWWKSETASSTLVCSGIMGAGKTVLCAIVVEDLVSSSHVNSTIAYFFCLHDDVVSLNARHIFGSLAR